MNRLLLWIAQGFGTGRIPIAPGTFGSVAGLLWFAVLILTRSTPLFAVGAVGGVALSVWLCGRGEKLLNQRDPGSIVFDEIAAIPLCFIAWIAIAAGRTGELPPLEYFFFGSNSVLTLGVFAAFRFFDVLKPWPVRQSQSLPGGWGVTADDVLAAGYVNLTVFAIHWWMGET